MPGGRSAAAARDQRDRVLAGLGGGFQHHHPLVREQRRAQQFGQLAGAHLTGAQPIHRDVVGAGLLARRAQDRAHRALDQQLFIAQYQVQPRNLLAHATIVS